MRNVKKNDLTVPFLITVAVLSFLTGIFFPFFSVTKLWVFNDSVSVVGGIFTLFQEGEYFLFAVLSLFTLAFPSLKLTLLAVIWAERKHRLERVRGLLEKVETLGKWSMLDVFVVAVLIVMMKAAGLAKIHISLGLYLFTLSVITTQVASMAIGRRLAALADSQTGAKASGGA